ncbi:peptidylprolyl isomerase [Bacteroidota bacterium]
MKKLYLLIFLILPSLLISGNKNPIVVIKTSMGDIVVEIYEKKAPITAGNFLKYVDAGLYKDGLFHRVVTMETQKGRDIKIEVIQGGKSRQKEGFKSIKHETTKDTGILHEDGTISMARSSVGSASSDFFICIGNQPELDFGGKRNADLQGFAAFGKVVKGMKIVKKIQQIPNDNTEYLKEPVKIIDIVRE